MSAHTPGPWGACRHGDCACGQIWSESADHPVATVTRGPWGDSYPSLRIVGPSMDAHAEAYMEFTSYGEVPPEIAAHNARLISAAPDLLAACEGAAQWLEGWASAEPYLTALRAAIAKATP